MIAALLAQLLGPFDPAWVTASRAAMTENCAKRSMKLSVLRGKYVLRVIAEHRCAVLEANLTHAHFGDGPDVFRYGSDAGLPAGQCLPESLLVVPQSADDAHS